MICPAVHPIFDFSFYPYKSVCWKQNGVELFEMFSPHVFSFVSDSLSAALPVREMSPLLENQSNKYIYIYTYTNNALVPYLRRFEKQSEDEEHESSVEQMTRSSSSSSNRVK